MGQNNSYPRIRKDETLRETARHGSPDYPFCYYEEDIWAFDLHCVDWHWHPEVELVYLERGEGECFLGSGRCTLRTGEGAFINAQTIHRFTAESQAILPNIVFLPSLLAPEDSLLYRRYLRPVLDGPLEYLVLSPEDARQREMLQTLREIFDAQGRGETAELETVGLLWKLWRHLYEAARRADGPAVRPPVQARAQLQVMLQYIQAHYAGHLTLEDIAGRVSLSKNSVLHLFRTHLHTSPVRYLIDYRLRQAARLLTGTGDSISAIALASGFDSAGYFARQFRARFGVTPGEYRRRAAERDGNGGPY